MKKSLFLSVCMNPTFQRTLVLPKLIPDTVNRIGEYFFDASGKGINVCRVLTQLGKNCIHLTQLGGSLRHAFLDLCAKDGLKLNWVESESAIRFAYTVIDMEKLEVTELVEEGDRVGEETEGRFLDAFDKILPEAAWLIISGSKAQGFSPALIPEMVRRAKNLKVSVILDIRGTDLLNSLPYRPDLIKPNFDEFAATFAPQIPKGQPLDKENTSRLFSEIYNQYGCRIILTRGNRNIWYSCGGELEEFPVEAVKPVNTTGSGDAFTAGLAAALSESASLKEALVEACRCGRLNAALIRPGVIF
ncbi:MAG: PfkB family carbohydrate kinase [Treponema sp.]|jgi:1-phosphofructokinase/tagatose 6-phosphate kinase|nr:PfkB family carbohydrate kinase [Treponema sp.]